MLTLADTITYINQALNYPSVTLTDIKLFLNQGLSELNTTLHIQLPDIDTMINEHREVFQNRNDVLIFSSKPTNTDIINLAKNDSTSNVVYDDENRVFITRGIYQQGTFDNLYAIYVDYVTGTQHVYKATMINVSSGLWLEMHDDVLNFDLSSYLAKDWIMLFLIPYVCYKYSVRDGDTGVLFSEEFVQGFQQLQNSFSVPSVVKLTDVAGELAYTKIIKTHLDNLNITVTTRAILEKYRIPRHLNSVYDDFYNTKGGWGL